MKSVVLIASLLCGIRCRENFIVEECPGLPQPSPTVNIPHETDCGKFYICQNGTKIEANCPSYLEFNPNIQICDWPKYANCSLKSIRGYSVPSSSTTIEYRTTTNKDIKCEEDDHISHETNCFQYYRCVYGKKVLKICPDNMLFNSKIGNCDFKYNVECASLVTEASVQKRDVAYASFVDDYIDSTETPEEENEEGDKDYWETFLKEKIYRSEAGREGGAVTIQEGEVKENECPEVTDEYGPTVLPHETKCNAYYRCFKGRKHLLYCPGMLQFNPRVLLCDWPMNVKCVGSKTPTSTPTSIPNVCPQTQCQDSTTYMPSLTDNRQFIRCDNGQQVYQHCPNGLVFDVNLKVCNLAHLAETVQIFK